jgi:hypothetical protein
MTYNLLRRHTGPRSAVSPGGPPDPQFIKRGRRTFCGKVMPPPSSRGVNVMEHAIREEEYCPV